MLAGPEQLDALSQYPLSMAVCTTWRKPSQLAEPSAPRSTLLAALSCEFSDCGGWWGGLDWVTCDGKLSPDSWIELSVTCDGKLSPDSWIELSVTCDDKLSADSWIELSVTCDGKLSPDSWIELSVTCDGKLSPDSWVELSEGFFPAELCMSWQSLALLVVCKSELPSFWQLAFFSPMTVSDFCSSIPCSASTQTSLSSALLADAVWPFTTVHSTSCISWPVVHRSRSSGGQKGRSEGVQGTMGVLPQRIWFASLGKRNHR